MAQAVEEAPCILVDTNVWLDVFIPNRVGSDTALRLIDVARGQGAALTYASHTALDVYQRVLVEQKAWARATGSLTEQWAIAIKRLAWDSVNQLQQVATAVPTDSDDLYLACKYRDRLDDLEDDLVLAACQRAQADYLVTNDRKLLARSPIETKTPQEMLRLLQAGLAKGSSAPAHPRDASYWMYRWLSRA